MANSDIRVRSLQVVFREVILDPPLTLSGGEITRVTVAGVHAEVESRAGNRGRGYGESVLSVPWSWPRSALSLHDRDAVLRELVHHHAKALIDLHPADPIALWQRQAATLDALAESATGVPGESVPRLAGLLSLGAVDNALHDAWANAAGADAFTLYTAEHLAEDLGRYGLPGIYPAAGIDPAPRTRLAVQHVVGVTDPLTGEGKTRSLHSWITKEHIDRLKIKTASIDPEADAARISEVYRVALAAGVTPRLAIDPNEGYPEIGSVAGMLDALAEVDADAAASIEYIEQPIRRGQQVDPAALRAVTARVPVLLDEGFTSLADLETLHESGWSGVVIKAGKGQSPAVIAAAVGRERGLDVVVQDLTATGAAFAHSARLAARLRLTHLQLEYNSRQYAPTGNDALAASYPGLAHVAQGHVALDGLDGEGLYGAMFSS